ncbi:hypothetical protein V8D89_008938 [Ganoderma adspersum]
MANTTLSEGPTANEVEFGLSYGAGYLSVAISSMYVVFMLVQGEIMDGRIINTTQQAATIHTFYYYLITKRHQLDLVLEAPNVWSVPTTSLLTAVAATTVDSFLTYRVWRLSGSMLVGGFCVILVDFVSAVFDVSPDTTLSCFTWFMHLHESLIQNKLDLQNLGVTAMSITAAADIIIAAVMSYYLLSKRTAFRRLMTLSITTGAISAVLAFLTLASFYDKLDVLFFYSLSGKVYSNGFLTFKVRLNVRSHIAGVWDNGESTVERSGGSVQLSNIPDAERGYRRGTESASLQCEITSIILEYKMI